MRRTSSGDGVPGDRPVLCVPHGFGREVATRGAGTPRTPDRDEIAAVAGARWSPARADAPGRSRGRPAPSVNHKVPLMAASKRPASPLSDCSASIMRALWCPPPLRQPGAVGSLGIRGCVFPPGKLRWIGPGTRDPRHALRPGLLDRVPSWTRRRRRVARLGRDLRDERPHALASRPPDRCARRVVQRRLLRRRIHLTRIRTTDGTMPRWRNGASFLPRKKFAHIDRCDPSRFPGEPWLLNV